MTKTTGNLPRHWTVCATCRFRMRGGRQRTELPFWLVPERNAGWPAGYGSFPVFLKVDGTLVGTAIFKRLPDAHEQPSEDTEIGWHLHPDVWGHGYATEIGRRLIRHGFEDVGLEELHAVVEPPNERSSAVALRLGMEHRGRTTAYYGGIELQHYVLERSDWARGGRDSSDTVRTKPDRRSR